MNKENRKAAQERRAKERAAEARRAKIRTWAISIIVIAAFVVLIIGIVMTSGCVGSSNTDTEESVTSSSAAATATSETEDDTDAVTLDTTEGLVAEDGDTVNIDYVGSIDGVAFDGGSTNGAGADLVLGSGTYIDGFEEQIVGHSVGETFDIEVTFPENYGSSDLAGQDAVFEITLNGIYK